MVNLYPLHGRVVVMAAWNTKFIIYLQKQKHSRDTEEFSLSDVFKTQHCCSTTSFQTGVKKGFQPDALLFLLSRRIRPYLENCHAVNLQAGLMCMCAGI